MKTYAVAPKQNVAPYLTPGKAYEVIEGRFGKSFSGVRGFSIMDDIGCGLYCLTEMCAHINYQNWQFVHK